MHRLDVVHVQAQVAGPVVTRARLCRHPLDSDIFEEFDEPAARDSKVDRPNVIELQAEDDLQEALVGAQSRLNARIREVYIASGFVRRGGHTVLAIERELEARIYATLPHHVGPLLQRHPLHCPLAFIGGRQSAESRQAGVEATRRLAGERFVWTEGTHLFPMEHPEAVATEVLRLLATMRAR